MLERALLRLPQWLLDVSPVLTTTVPSSVPVAALTVMTLAAVRAVPSSITDVFAVSGASALRTFVGAQLPAALPALLAAARIAVPAAVVGALLVEWLATGTGIGYLMLRATTTFSYDQLWAAVVVCTGTMIVAYTIVSALESTVFARMGE